MAVVVLTPKDVDYNGVEAWSDTADYKAATAVDGYTFINDGRTCISIKNASGAVNLTATIVNAQTCSYGGSTSHNISMIIPWGDDWLSGFFAVSRFNATSTGIVTVTLSAFADISACAYRFI
jgi:hypothetical protein